MSECVKCWSEFEEIKDFYTLSNYVKFYNLFEKQFIYQGSCKEYPPY